MEWIAWGLTLVLPHRCSQRGVEAFFSSLKSEVADRFYSWGEAKMKLFDSWSSRRLLHRGDGMGVTLTDAVLAAGLDQVWWYKTTLRRLTASNAKEFLKISSLASPTRSNQARYTRSTSTSAIA
jgi:hypothetical protein